MSSLSSFIWVKFLEGEAFRVPTFSSGAVYVTTERDHSDRSSKDFMFICSLQLCDVVREKRSNVSERLEKVSRFEG